jgi:hypothetical protein
VTWSGLHGSARSLDVLVLTTDGALPPPARREDRPR